MCKKLFEFISFSKPSAKLYAQRVAAILLSLAGVGAFASSSSYILIDKNATPETKALYKNLQKMRGHQLLFGQQDSLAYGFKWNGDADRSDAKDVAGSHVALMGWDLGHLEAGEEKNLDGVPFATIRTGIQNTFLKGGVNTVSWHIANFEGGDYRQKPKDPSIYLTGGAKHDEFKRRLDLLADFNEQLKVNGKYIPIIFRPWHEHNGDWFWWGKGNISEQNYIELWRFTVDYLRNTKNVHNFIIASSPDRSRIDLKNFATDYLYAYPGDNYVDIMGFDDYKDFNYDANPAVAAEQFNNFVQSLTEISTIAKQHHKLAALTEGGSEALHNPQFFTQIFLKGLLANKATQQFVYAMVWRNATDGGYNGHHFYVPYMGHDAADDFKKFKEDKRVLFLDEVPTLYQ